MPSVTKGQGHESGECRFSLRLRGFERVFGVLSGCCTTDPLDAPADVVAGSPEWLPWGVLYQTHLATSSPTVCWWYDGSRWMCSSAAAIGDVEELGIKGTDLALRRPLDNPTGCITSAEAAANYLFDLSSSIGVKTLEKGELFDYVTSGEKSQELLGIIGKRHNLS